VGNNTWQVTNPCNGTLDGSLLELNPSLAPRGCNDSSRLMDCPHLAKPSVLNRGTSFTMHLDPPMLDIRVFGTNETSGLPNGRVCNHLALPTVEFVNYEYSLYNNVTRLCQAGNVYEWGFSYLLLLFTCIAQSLFAVIMYALWLEVRRNSVTVMRRTKFEANGVVWWEKEDYPSVISHATEMVRQAEEGYREEVRTRSARKLDTTVWKGKEGMRAPAW